MTRAVVGQVGEWAAQPPIPPQFKKGQCHPNITLPELGRSLKINLATHSMARSDGAINRCILR